MVANMVSPKKIILLYHRIGEGRNDERYSSENRSISKSKFRSQLSWLSSFADFVSLSEILSANSERWMVSVTFDDGYKSNIEIGLPLFRSFEVPVTWFICTSFVEDRQRLPWWDLMDFVCEEVGGVVRVEGQVYDLSKEDDLLYFRKTVRHRFLNTDDTGQSDLREQLEAICRERGTVPLNAFASPECVAYSSKSPWITVGGHTVNHINMGIEAPSCIEKEVEAGRRTLQRWTGQPVEWFAYPYGKDQHWDETAQSIVSRAGFRGAVTTNRGYVNDEVSEYAIPRFNVPPTWSMRRFKTSVLALGAVDRAIKVKKMMFE